MRPQQLSPEVRDLLKRYGLALALANLALFLRGQLPLPEGTAIYQLSIAAVVLSAWYGGRGPGVFASLTCATGTLYWFIPPVSSFEVSPDHVLGFFIFIALCLLLSAFSSGRRHAEHALRTSEERFHALVQFSFDVYWETDTEHRFTRQEFSERLTDAPPRGTEIGKTRWEIPYVEPDEEAWRKHRATLDAHLPFRDFEVARPTADGGTRYVSVSGIPSFDEIGRFVGYRGVGRHITGQKRAETEHRSHLKFLESMDRINRAMQGTEDLQQMLSDVLLATLDIFDCDRAWLIYPCDPDAPSWHAVMEHTRPQFPGAFALQAELPVDRDVAAAFAAARVAPGAVLFGPDHDLKIPALAADRFAVRSQMAMAIDAKADKPYLLGLHQCSRVRVWTAEEQRLFQEIGRRLSDGISALSILRSLRDSERKLDAAQRIAHVGWWERDFASNRVALSEEVQRMFGMPPVDLPQWQDRWTHLIHPEDRAAAAEAEAAALRGGPRYDVEYRVVRPDGAVRVVHSQGDVAWDESGHPLRQFGVMQDITELRQSEDELSEVKERFRVLAESSLTGIYLTEQDRFTYVNPALAKMFGYEVAEVVGRLRSTDLTCPDDRPLAAENMRRRLQGDVEGMRYEFRGLRKDGSVFPVEVHGRRIERGGRIGELGTLIDISERKRAEESLRESEAYLTEAQRLSNTGSWALDVASNRYLYTSEEFDRIFGFDPGGEKLTREAIFERMHPEDRISWIRTLEKSVREKLDTTSQYRIVLPDGSIRHIHTIRHPVVNSAGEVVKLVGTSIDITQRKRAEEELLASEARFRTLVDRATDAFFLLDEQLTVVDVNRQACESLGWSREELIGMHPREFDAALDEPAIRRLAQRAGAGEIITFETRHRRKDGTAFPVEIRSGTFKQGDDLFYLALARDISERKQAEEALRESEKRYRTLFEKANDAIFLENERDDIVEVNERACTLLGYSRDELLRMKVPDLQAPEVRGQAGRVTRERIEKHEGATFETVDLHRSGRRIPVEVTIAGIFHRGENLVLSVVRDITERKRVETEVRARQEMLDLAQRAARALAFDWHIGARESENRWSPELEAMYGLEPGTFDGTSQGWKKLLHPDDRPALELAIERAHESGDVAAEYRVIHNDGSVHWLRAKGRMFLDAQGQPARMIGFMLDITDQRSAEEELRMTDARFRALVDLAPDAFMLHAEDGTVIDVNLQACEALGYARDELIGMSPAQFDAALDREAVRQVSERVTGGEVVTIETRHRRKDGTVFPVEVRGRRFRQGDHWVGISLSRDVTERKRVEEGREALRQLEADLARMSRFITMGELTASIAHEVNQPLGAMVANAAACERWLAARRPETEKVRRVLKSIAADGQRASAVIGRIRALMKRQAPRKDLLDLSEAIREVLALMQQELRRHAIVLLTRLDEHMPPVRADKVQLQQVLLNLVVNAIEAMSAIEDRPRELTIVSAQEGPDSVRVEVRDSGPGLGAGQAEQLFEAFYTTKEEGMGIGLAISRSIVEAHGGRLSAAPNAPHGTVFRFSLPAGA